jgi:hypothetical protein
LRNRPLGHCPRARDCIELFAGGFLSKQTAVRGAKTSNTGFTSNLEEPPMTAWGGSPVALGSEFLSVTKATRQLGAGPSDVRWKAGSMGIACPGRGNRITSQSLPANVPATALALVVSVKHNIIGDVCSCLNRIFLSEKGSPEGGELLLARRIELSIE